MASHPVPRFRVCEGDNVLQSCLWPIPEFCVHLHGDCANAFFLFLHALLPAQFQVSGLAALRLLGMFHCLCVFNVALFVAIRRPRPTSDRAQLEPSVLTDSPLPSRQAPLLPCGATRPTAPKASLSAVLVTLRPGSREELPDAPGLCYPTFFPGLDPVRLRRPMPLYFSISFFGSVPTNTSGPF